jgi:FKBP-type peptidyl-prolyl cis-trans isomerase SlyD
MTETIQKGDFIELEYTGKTKDEGIIFDTTSAVVAKAAELHMQKQFKPIIVCAGEGHVLPGLDKRLVGASLGKHSFIIPAEEAFGKKSAKLLQLIPRRIFNDQKIQPVPGLEINVDNQTGIIRTVSGGRIIVDFNHPLASRDLIYDVEVKAKVHDQTAQVKAVLEVMRIPFASLTITDNKAEVLGATNLPDAFVQMFAKDIVRLTGITEITFKKKETHEHKKVEKKDE